MGSGERGGGRKKFQEQSVDVDDRLKESRDLIDRYDVEIVKLLNLRSQAALRLGRLKEKEGLDTYQPNREKVVLEQVRNANSGPLDDQAVTRLFERIIDENRSLEEFKKKK
tara:strand:+ start:16228 stop:16560 length:333 start_codon:yes stop_codon:yes gene_type:complete